MIKKHLRLFLLATLPAFSQSPVTLTVADKAGLFWDASAALFNNSSSGAFAVQPSARTQFQNFIWTPVPNTVGWHVCAEGGPCLYDLNGTMMLGTVSDVFVIMANGAVLDATSIRFVEAPTKSGGSVTTGSAQTPWIFSARLH